MRFLTRTLFALGRFSSRVSVVLNYAACGTMNLAELKDGIRRSWEGFHRRDEDIASGLMEWERNLVDRFVRPGDAVLVVGAGSGRDVIPLAERGCAVTGVEPASAPLALARRALASRKLSAHLVEGFFEDIDPGGPFDVVMFSYYSYTYIPESRRRVAALRKAAAVLRDGGRILVSYPPLPGPHPFPIRVARASAALFRSDVRLEPGDHITVHESAFRGFAHSFTDGEVAREAAAAGLRVVHEAGYPDPIAVLAQSSEA